MPRHVVLVGLPGCGKSTVGRLVAEGLGAPLFDIDLLLVREMGMPVAQIFGMMGEPRFREMEREAVLAAVAALEPAVIVPGGGWAAQPGQMDDGPAPSLSWSICAACPAPPPSGSEQGEARPLLAGSDPVERMRKLLEAREPFYKLADYEVAAERGGGPGRGRGGGAGAAARRAGKSKQSSSLSYIDLRFPALRQPTAARFLLAPEIDHPVRPEITLETWRHERNER